MFKLKGSGSDDPGFLRLRRAQVKSTISESVHRSLPLAVTRRTRARRRPPVPVALRVTGSLSGHGASSSSWVRIGCASLASSTPSRTSTSLSSSGSDSDSGSATPPASPSPASLRVRVPHWDCQCGHWQDYLQASDCNQRPGQQLELEQLKTCNQK